jgi:hypothetical protein
MALLFHLADSDRVIAKAQERLVMPSFSPHHLQLRLIPLQRLDHRLENDPPVFVAEKTLGCSLRMRHPNSSMGAVPLVPKER